MEGFNDITFGLYVRNGVLLETGENVGISYVVDDIIFNIVEAEAENVTAHTYYGFSELLFQISQDGAVESIERILFRILNNEVDLSGIEALKKRNLGKCRRRKPEQAYYRLRAPKSRLTEPVCGRRGNVRSLGNNDISSWMDNTYCSEKLLCILTSKISKKVAVQVDKLLNSYNISHRIMCQHPSRYAHEYNVGYDHMTSRYGNYNTIVSYRIDIARADILSLDAIACIIRMGLGDALASRNATILSPVIIADCIPEFRIWVKCRQKDSAVIRDMVIKCINYCIGIADRCSIQTIIDRMHDEYINIISDQVELNKIAGWNCLYNIFDEIPMSREVICRNVTMESIATQYEMFFKYGTPQVYMFRSYA